MRRLKVIIVDMQPITPAIGGGRQRLLGLYHALGPNIDAVYVGSYDWPGESFRDQQLTPGLREICVPLSAEQHAAAQASADLMGGRVMIDLEFCDQAKLSPVYLETARQNIFEADIVIFSHPWAYRVLRDALRPEQLLVYDSQNVEAVLRVSLHDELPQAGPVLARVAEVEYELCQDADVILTCSHDDRDTFSRIYDVDWARTRVVPNGIFAFDQSSPANEQRRAERNELAPEAEIVGIFLGSDYGPNNEAANFIAQSLAPKFPGVTFAVLGSCCQTLSAEQIPRNVRLVGVVDDNTKRQWMRASDFALNPLSRGSGTSIKMFDFMAAGLPTITTEVGARGIVSTGQKPFEQVALSGFPNAIERLIADSDARNALSVCARNTVEKFYAWERISPTFGCLLRKRWQEKAHLRPFFTVVIPSYERPHMLDTLFDRLKEQTERSFEVVVVDQSVQRWLGADVEHGFQVTYVHSVVKGAVSARNLGGYLASGSVIAFTDDDCEPVPTWLTNAKKYFDKPGVVGVEGLIRSDHVGDPEWRPVTNIGFEGLGFMTANLFVRNERFQQLDGFDLAFDEPHFREDTDFGWRLQQIGAVPYAADAVVYHPAHRRDLVRESHAERNRFFEKDAILLNKHPDRYQTLFFAERHFQFTAGFWEHFQRGADKYNVALPSWIEDSRRGGTS